MPTRRTPDAVASLLNGFLDGTDEWAWDDFESVPLADPFLESIRQRAIPMGPPNPDTTDLRNLLAELKSRFPSVAAVSTTPRMIEVDAGRWRTAVDAVAGLKLALGAVDGHGDGIDAFIDSMIYGGMLEAETPYEVVVRGLAHNKARTFIEDLSQALGEVREWRRANYGDDVRVSVSLHD